MGHVSNINTLKSIYYAHFHYVIKYGIIWGNTSNTVKIFHLKENCKNYGWNTTEKFVQKSV